MDIFEESENQRVLADVKISEKMIFIQSRLYMAMQVCILVLRVGAQISNIKISISIVYKIVFLFKMCFQKLRVAFR